MNAEGYAALKEEAIGALHTNVATGLEGFRQKGLDRLRALNVPTEGFRSTTDVANLLRLIRHEPSGAAAGRDYQPDEQIVEIDW